MDTPKNLGKILVALLLITALAVQASAQAEQSSLEKTDVDIEPRENGVHFNSTYLDKEINWQNILIPDDYHADLQVFNQPTNIDPDQEGNSPFVVNYNFENFNSPNNDPEAIPDTLNDYNFNDNQRIEVTGDNSTNLADFEEDELFSTTDGRIRVNLSTHYNALIADYTILDENQEEVITTEQDIYYGEEPGLVPFTTEASTDDETGTATQTLKKDNMFQEEKHKRLSLMYKGGEAQLEGLNTDLEYETCEDNSYIEDDRPELKEAGVNPDFIIDGTFGYQYDCFNITIPEHSAPEIEIEYSYEDFTEEQGDDFIIEETPDFNAYLIGSGGATRLSSGYNLCGTLDGYENIIIDGTITLDCDSTIEASNTIEVRGGIDGAGEDGEREEPGEYAESLTVDATNVKIEGEIDLQGGDGGPGECDNDEDGEPGGEGGDLTINAFETTITSDIHVHGGAGGHGQSCYERDGGFSYYWAGDGGAAKDAGQININTDYFHLQNSEITHYGGHGGHGGHGRWDYDDDSLEARAGSGTNAGSSTNLEIDAMEIILDNAHIIGRGSEGGDGGFPDSFDAGFGGDPPTTALTATTLNITESTIDASVERTGYISAEFRGEEGVDGGTINLNGQHREVIDSDFIAHGGKGGDNEAVCDDYTEYRAGHGGDGGTINHNLYEKDVTDTLFNVQGGEGGDSYGCSDNDHEGGDGGDGGLIDITYRDFLTEVFNTFNDEGGDPGSGEFDGVKGDPGTTNITQNENLTIESDAPESDIEIQDINITSADGEQEYRLDHRNDVLMTLEFISDQELSNTPTTSWFNEEDQTRVDQEQMTLQSVENIDGEYHHTYTYEHNISQERESAGTWLTDIRILDNHGNTYTETEEFIYQNTDIDRGNPIQRQATFGQTIPYDQRVTYENPSNTAFNNVEVRFELFEGVNWDFFEITRESNDEVIDHEVDQENNYLYFNISEIEGEQSIDYNIQYDLQPIQVDEEIEYEEEDGRVTAFQDLTVEAPSPNITIQDIDAHYDFVEPERVVDWSLFLGDEEITFNEDFDPFASDSDNTGFQNQLNWFIPALNPDDPPQEYTIQTDLGEPIITHREDVITNRPVEEGKPIQWRAGFAFENNNDFVVPYSERLRVPLEASNIRVDGELQDSQFDRDGTYVVYEEALPANSNETSFVRYETRSISTTETVERPEQHTVGENSEVIHEISIENLAQQDLQNVTDTITVDYAENLALIDQDNEEVMDEQDIVQDEYTINLDRLIGGTTKDLLVAYEIPTASKEHIRNGQTDQGDNLAVWEIENDNNRLLENVYFETEEIDCIEVEEIRILDQGNQTGTNTIEDYECGSTIVPLGDLNSEETIRIGIAYTGEEKQFSDETNGGLNVLVGMTKWLLIAALLIGGAEAGRRFYE